MLKSSMVLQTKVPQGLLKQNFILMMRGPDFTPGFCNKHFKYMGIMEVKARRVDDSGTKMVFVHHSREERKRVSSWRMAVQKYNKDMPASLKIHWAGTTEDEDISTSEDGQQIRGSTAYNYILQRTDFYLQWDKASLPAPLQNTPLASSSSEVSQSIDPASPSLSEGQLPQSSQFGTEEAQPPINLDALSGSSAQGQATPPKSAQGGIVEEQQQRAQVGEKRKIEELLQYAPALDRMRANEEYCVNNIDQILSISRQKRDDECAIAAAAATATREKIKEHEAAQALSLEKTKEHRAAQAAQEKLSEMRIKEEERLSEIKIKEEEKLASIRIADKDKEMLLNNQKIRILELQHPQSAPVAPIFNAAAGGQNAERKEALVDIYKEGRFPRLRSSQFGGMARYVRWRYENQYNKVVFKAGGHDMYPKLTTAAVKQWIKAWLEEPNQL